MCIILYPNKNKRQQACGRVILLERKLFALKAIINPTNEII